MKSYIKGFFHGLGSLLTGLKVTGREFFTPKVTEQYPENRATLRMFDRFCGELTMPHDAEGRNKCIACGLCQSACPNGTIRITTEVVADPETGKSRKRLVLYEYDLGVRYMGDYLRISTGSKEENQRLYQALSKILSQLSQKGGEQK